MDSPATPFDLKGCCGFLNGAWPRTPLVSSECALRIKLSKTTLDTYKRTCSVRPFRLANSNTAPPQGSLRVTRTDSSTTAPPSGRFELPRTPLARQQRDVSCANVTSHTPRVLRFGVIDCVGSFVGHRSPTPLGATGQESPTALQGLNAAYPFRLQRTLPRRATPLGESPLVLPSRPT